MCVSSGEHVRLAQDTHVVSACASAGAWTTRKGLLVPYPVDPPWAILSVHGTAIAHLQMLEHASHVGRVV